MARGSTRSTEVNEITKQIIAEAAFAEYAELGINNNIESLYSDKGNSLVSKDYLGREKKPMPTIGSWYQRILKMAKENKNQDYRFHYSRLLYTSLLF